MHIIYGITGPSQKSRKSQMLITSTATLILQMRKLKLREGKWFVRWDHGQGVGERNLFPLFPQAVWWRK